MNENRLFGCFRHLTAYSDGTKWWPTVKIETKILHRLAISYGVDVSFLDYLSKY